jgi:hypothetical protein
MKVAGICQASAVVCDATKIHGRPLSCAWYDSFRRRAECLKRWHVWGMGAARCCRFSIMGEILANDRLERTTHNGPRYKLATSWNDGAIGIELNPKAAKRVFGFQTGDPVEANSHLIATFYGKQASRSVPSPFFAHP